MEQRIEMRLCRMAGKKSEHAELVARIKARQSGHDAVAGMQAQLVVLTNEILKLELGQCS